MTSEHPPKDHTFPAGAGPAVRTPGPTTRWQIRIAAQEIQQLLEHITSHPNPRRLQLNRAQAISAQFAALTADGRIAVDQLEWLQEARGQLRKVRDSLEGIIDAPPAGDPDAWRLPQMIRQEARQLPTDVSPWPWRDRDAKRQMRAWARAHALLTEPIDRDKVVKAWTEYQALTQQPAAQIEASPEPEGA
jgi:hypothetical protein